MGEEAGKVNSSIMTNVTNSIVNGTLTQMDLLDKLSRKNISEPMNAILVILYTTLIIIGSSGNFLVIFAVLRNKQMRTPRNIFIVNLAISDLLLCLVTMPLTLIEIQTKTWKLGETPILCRTIGSLQGLSIYVSTLTILAIALDRYQLIVGCPVKDNIPKWCVTFILASIWTVSAIFCIPCYQYRKLVHYNFDIPELSFKHKITYCVEEWPIIADISGNIYYSLFTVFLQYFIPIVVLSGAYMRIYFRLKQRIILTQAPSVNNRESNRNQNRDKKMKRTNCLLIGIFLIFGISWLPMNIFNFYVDWTGIVMNSEHIYIIYAVCHMMGMSSACSNPLLYGWLNDNFRKEFYEIFKVCKINKNRRSNSELKLKALDVSYAGQRKLLSEVGEIDKQSKLLLRPQGTCDGMEMKSEFTLVE